MEIMFKYNNKTIEAKTQGKDTKTRGSFYVNIITIIFSGVSLSFYI